MKKVIHEKCGTQIGWHDGKSKKGFTDNDNKKKARGTPPRCPNCGVISPQETNVVLGND